MLWVPPGYAHGFYVTGGGAEVVYKCTAAYSPDHDRAIRWDDPEISVDWPLTRGRGPGALGQGRGGAVVGWGGAF